MVFQRFTFAAVVGGGLGLCSGSVATAADMPVKAPRMPTAISYNWTGFYGGLNGGYAWGTSSWRDDPALGLTDLGSHTTRGGIFGGQVGYNWQDRSLVLGLEADVNWASIKGSHVDPAGSDLNTKVSWLGTLVGRVGYAQNQALLYGLAGATWATFKYQDFTAPGAGLNGENSGTRWGYTVGGGLEYAFAMNWSAKVEYNYLDFGTRRLGFSGGVSPAFTQDITERMHLMKIGVNYRFAR
jgi:outer membrane immunogenic protein